jgi:hypothetical protein
MVRWIWQDQTGPDEAGNAYASAARERVLEAVAWLVEEAGEGRVSKGMRSRYGLCLFMVREIPAGGGKSESMCTRMIS